MGMTGVGSPTAGVWALLIGMGISPLGELGYVLPNVTERAFGLRLTLR